MDAGHQGRQYFAQLTRRSTWRASAAPRCLSALRQSSLAMRPDIGQHLMLQPRNRIQPLSKQPTAPLRCSFLCPGGGHAAAGIPWSCRWCCGRVAVRGPRATVRPGGRLHSHYVARPVYPPSDGVSAGLEGNRLYRRAERRNRPTIGRRESTAAVGVAR